MLIQTQRLHFVFQSFFIGIIAFVGLPSQAVASHIVGGEMYYNKLNDTTYEVILNYYVDCVHGRPDAIAQDEFNIFGVYEGNKLLPKQYSVHRSLPQRINTVNYTCIYPPTGVCVDYYYYDTIIYLKPSSFGYTIVFQRCCRNETILNIQEPSSTGSTYFAQIPADTTVSENNSPRFNSLPPNYLCVNEPFVFDYSANDPDGDSLAYRLCAPYVGGSTGNSRPLVPSGPPFGRVKWNFGYNAQRPISVKDSVYLNPYSGKMSFRPMYLGQFVFAVCVDEFRDNQLINTTFRDYQFNVMKCELQVDANFEVPDVVCETGVSVHSEDAIDSLLWDFGDSTSEKDFAKSRTAKYVYPTRGDYSITLWTYKSGCKDSLILPVKVYNQEDLLADDSLFACPGDSVAVELKRFKNASYSFDPDNFKVVDDSLFYIHKEGKLTVKIKVDDCVLQEMHELYYDQLSVGMDTTRIVSCRKDRIAANFTGNAAEELKWSLNGNSIGNENQCSFLVDKEKPGVLKLFASDKYCQDSISQIFTKQAIAKLEFEIPNVFTPNGDNINDNFTIAMDPIHNECVSFELHIYNRWGQLMYQSEPNEVIPKWNGENKMNNEPASDGVYFYRLFSSDRNYYGTITLVR